MLNMFFDIHLLCTHAPNVILVREHILRFKLFCMKIVLMIKFCNVCELCHLCHIDISLCV